MAADESPTQRLLDLALTGDGEARAQLIDHACRRLEHLTRRMLRGFPHVGRWEETGDVLQNAMIRLQRALATAPIESPLHFWRLAARQVRLELLDLARHHQGPQGHGAKHHTDGVPADDPGGALARAPQAGCEPADLDAWTRFHERVELLPEDEREVFSLLWYEGLTQEQASAVLGVTVRTVKRRWAAARVTLQQALQDGSPR